MRRLADATQLLGEAVDDCNEAFWERNEEDATLEGEHYCCQEELRTLEQENTALREQVAALQESVSYLTVKATQAPPPKWALRQARRWQDVGMTKDEAVRFAQKVMRWTHTYMIKAKSLKETEDAEVQEDPTVRADDCGVDGAG